MSQNKARLDDEQAMRERHTSAMGIPSSRGAAPALTAYCRCGQRRPCDAIQALDALAEARRDHASIIDATKAAGIGWRENEDGAETCHNVRAEEAERDRDEAFKILARLGLVRHAATWITREEADRISKDGP